MRDISPKESAGSRFPYVGASHRKSDWFGACWWRRRKRERIDTQPATLPSNRQRVLQKIGVHPRLALPTQLRAVSSDLHQNLDFPSAIVCGRRKEKQQPFQPTYVIPHPRNPSFD